MKRLFLFVLLLLVSTIVACSSVRVSQDYDLAKPLPVLKSYQWLTAEQTTTGDVRVDNPLLNERIRRAIDRVLQEKGYQAEPTGRVDFQVAYQYTIRQRLRSDDVSGTFGFGVGTYGRHGGVAVGTGHHVSQYDEGLLVIDLTDNQGNLLWRGQGTRYLPTHPKPEKTEKIYNELVEKILAQFPPGK